MVYVVRRNQSCHVGQYCSTVYFGFQIFPGIISRNKDFGSEETISHGEEPRHIPDATSPGEASRVMCRMRECSILSWRGNLYSAYCLSVMSRNELHCRCSIARTEIY